MKKAEFIELVKTSGSYSTNVEADRAVKAFTDAVIGALCKKEKVALVGFGTFSTVDVAEKSGTVPGTTKTYTKAAHTAPKFKAGQTLKDRVSEGK